MKSLGTNIYNKVVFDDCDSGLYGIKSNCKFIANRLEFNCENLFYGVKDFGDAPLKAQEIKESLKLKDIDDMKEEVKTIQDNLVQRMNFIHLRRLEFSLRVFEKPMCLSLIKALIESLRHYDDVEL